MDGNRIRRRISLVCCVLRGKGLEAKVWGFVRAVLLRSLAVAAALTWTIATYRQSVGAKELDRFITGRLFEDEHDDDDFSGEIPHRLRCAV